jgi:hypothetical protein
VVQSAGDVHTQHADRVMHWVRPAWPVDWQGIAGAGGLVDRQRSLVTAVVCSAQPDP